MLFRIIARISYDKVSFHDCPHFFKLKTNTCRSNPLMWSNTIIPITTIEKRKTIWRKIILTNGQVHVNNGLFPRCASLAAISQIELSSSAITAFVLFSLRICINVPRPSVSASHVTENYKLNPTINLSTLGKSGGFSSTLSDTLLYLYSISSDDLLPRSVN